MGLMMRFGGVAGARAINSLSQAVLLILLAREIGPRDFGIIAAFTAAQVVCIGISSLNSPTFVSREVVLNEWEMARASLRLNRYLTAGTVVALGILSAIVIRDPWLLVAVIGNSLAVSSEATADARLALSYAQGRMSAPIVSITSRASTSLLLYILLTFSGVNILLSFGIARIASAIVGNVIAVSMTSLPNGEIASLGKVFRVQLPLAAALAMGSLRSLDNILVTLAVGPTASGTYAAVSKVLQPFTIAPMALAPVLIPKAAIAEVRDVRRWLDLMYIIALSLSLGSLISLPISEWLVVAIFGEGFSGGGIVMSAVLLRVGVMCVSPVMGAVLQARRLDADVAKNSTMVAILTLLFVFCGALVDGALGAAIGYSISALVGLTRLWLVGRVRVVKG